MGSVNVYKEINKAGYTAIVLFFNWLRVPTYPVSVQCVEVLQVWNM